MFGETQITYADLERKAKSLSQTILLNAASSDLIGISTTPGIDMVIGLLAIFKAGKAYLPLDPTYPVERLQQIATDSGVGFCLADESENDFFQQVGVKTLGFNSDSQSASNTVRNRSEIACVLYTSGSTGKPKGVRLLHSGLINLLDWQRTQSKLEVGTKTLQFCHLSFDAAFQEIFVPLTTGGTLYIINDDIRLDANNLLNYINSKRINRIFLPFVTLQYLCEAAEQTGTYPAALEEAISGGEQMKITPQIAGFFSRLPDCTLINGYGPTETSVCASVFILRGDTRNWPPLPPIGRPILNVEIFILDENLNLLPAGTAGEICIGGAGVSGGYLNRPELTLEKFADWHHPAKGLIKIYRTGDLAKYLPDGNLEFLGRVDDQVKIRGNRVEPGEVEVCLAQSKGVQQAVVVVREDIPGQKKLVAYVVTAPPHPEVNELRSALEKQLPDFMIPAAFVFMKDLPKTVSGKVDKKALPLPEAKRPELNVLYRSPAGLIETKIAEMWQSLLQIDRVGADDNFFDLGGNSLLAQRTIALLRQQGYILPVTKLYQFPSASQIAAYLEQGDTSTENKKSKHVRNGQQAPEIAVIAMSGRFPGADCVEDLWHILEQEKETITFFDDSELDPFISKDTLSDPEYVKARGILNDVDQFDAAFFGINPKIAELMDPQQRVFLEISREALETAGYLPQRHQSTIGVFAGCGNNTYFLNNVQTQKSLIDRVGSIQVMTVNEKDYIAMRTAYELNLKGPAVSVLSSSSTSLLAIAQAAESIRNGQCDLALAGGVSITVPVKSGHVYQEGSMLNKDGHSRPFDDNASGTVFSDGAGVVLLKSLEAAVRDGDTIFAVIKGIGVNNDGAGKGSFTAPNADGQAGSIRMALQDADADPRSIGYIETHGTATPIGDPIEIEGLTEAFGITDKKQFCAIGSIKGNIGHLMHAAGVAGFIKTALALHYQKIPASINYEKPNRNINFGDTPFYVNTTPKPWQSDTLRRAGVSSFGVGGTNVHLVLEEYINAENEILSEAGPQLINWSAKTEKSNDLYASELARYLEEHSDIQLSDLSYTLQTTREDFHNRRFIVATNIPELLQKLGKSANTRTLSERAANIAFVFPGQGSQHSNMGLGLYQTQPVFKEAVDRCCLILNEYLDRDLREVIFSDSEDNRINNTYYTQPGLFTIEYALAMLWMSWGIKPNALTGHSIGEFVAGHIAGVFSLEDALKLVANRSRLISGLPAGSMLAVKLSPEKIQSLLPADISIAAVNSPNLTVISGPPEAIDSLARTLTADDVINMPINTSHAFHSPAMDKIKGDFGSIVRTVQLNTPKIPIVSTVTGTWMTDAQATDPLYWQEQLRVPVFFSDALGTLIVQNNTVLLECGPGSVTTSLARQQVIKKPFAAIASLPGKGLSGSDSQDMLTALGQLWQHGISADWKALYHDRQPNIIRIPNYQFDKKRCWVDPIISTTTNSSTIETDLEKSVKIAEAEPKPNAMRREALLGRIKKIIDDASGIDITGMPATTSFIEIGLDSLLLTQIATTIKKEFGVPVTFRQLNEELSSPDLLLDFLDKNVPENAFRTAPEAQPASTTLPENPSFDAILQQLQNLTSQVATLQGEKSAGISQPEIKPTLQLSDEEQIEVKKPFGASPRIEKKSAELGKEQLAFLEEFTSKYNQKTKGSKEYTQKNRPYMADPRVVSGFKPLTKEITYPIVVNRSKGSHLWDIDGNEYIDALNGFGSSMLGYQPEPLKNAIAAQLEKGYEIGPQHELAGDVARLVCDFTGADRAAICSTGSEAVMGTMRVARTVTGRSLIVAFSGSYHGIFDEVIIRGTKQFRSIPAAAGIMPEAVQNMLILDYGTDESLRIIRERAHELAAVLVEPVQSRRPDFQPVEFLKEVRKITEASGTTLIFDEVITGFRMHPGGAQALFGIKADIASYGKVVGGGLPIGIIAGKKEFMDALDGGSWQFGDNSFPEVGVTYFAGTFVRHPLALAAAKASLEYFKMRGPQLQEELNAKCDFLTTALSAVCRKSGLNISVVKFGSLWRLKFGEDVQYSELIFTLMRYRGIHILDGFPCFITEAHTENELNQIAKAFEDSLNDLIRSKFLHSNAENSFNFVKPRTEPTPPVEGARLGRDQAGNPAWFIEDPEHPGKFMQVGN